MITLEQLNAIFGPSDKYKNFVEPLNKILPLYEINTTKRIAAFIANVGHESGKFAHVAENLNYSEQGLLNTFGKYFNAESAKSYARNPQMIADRVYANRLGNGDVASGDGYRYRGRGLIQLTGKENYQKFATSLGKSLEETVKYLETPEGACASAGWFWNSRKLNALADKDEFTQVCKVINGGTIGLSERIAYYNKALNILG